MRYIARLSPVSNPLQAVNYAMVLSAIRGLIQSMPPGTRADVYELTEVYVKSFIKGDKDVVLEEAVLPPGHTGGAVAAVAQSGDAGAARKDGDPVK